MIEIILIITMIVSVILVTLIITENINPIVGIILALFSTFLGAFTVILHLWM